MNDRQEDKLNMYLTVQTVCTDYNAAAQSIPAFAQSLTAFSSAVARLQDLASKEATGITGASEDKARTRRALTEAAIPLAAILQAWASISAEEQIAEQASFTRSDFLHSRDTQALANAQAVYDLAEENAAALADYGFTNDMLDSLGAAIDAYRTKLNAPREAIVDRKQINREMESTFDEADLHLKQRMDKLIEIFALTNAEFYQKYQDARIIVDSGGGTAEEEGETPSE